MKTLRHGHTSYNLSRLPLMIAAAVVALICIVGSAPCRADEVPDMELKVKAYRGFTHIVDEYGDTCRLTYIRDVYVFPPLKFKNKKQEQFYWRTVRDVRKALPYARLITETLLETYEYIETLPTQQERERYLKQMEGAVFEQYKPALRKFTKSQAKMLVKLIRRQTDQSGYDILKAFLGSFRATFWQGFGRLFGVNLKGDYRPDKNSDDAIIERVATLIEQGQL